MIKGIHHITAISSNAQKTYNFYTDILGLRFTKKTVNFDAPDVYHLYFSDYSGTPGTVLTFFPFPNAGTGMRGIGQVTSISFAVSKTSLGFWLERFVQKGIKHSQISKRFGEKYITFYDPDGLQLELVAVDEKDFGTDVRLEVKDIKKENAINGFYSATLSLENLETTETILKEVLDYEIKEKDGFYTRYKNKNSDFACFIDILEMKGWVEGIQSAGTVHHIAFTVAEKDQTEIIEKIKKHNLVPTSQIDRDYFKSVYFREPNNILFEIATIEPGFTIDEKLEDLGTSLKIPKQHESQREYIQSMLPPLKTHSDSQDEENLSYEHKFIKGKNKNVIVLFHGTGADETDLIPMAKNLATDFSILSLRGKVSENGMNRFFERYQDGSFNEEDIKFRSSEIKEFLNDASKKYDFDLEKMFLLGYSNGANIVASMLLLKDIDQVNAILIRPTMPIESSNSEALLNTKVLILSGKVDEYTTAEKIENLEKSLKDLNADVISKITGESHPIEMKDLEEIKNFIDQNKK